MLTNTMKLAAEEITRLRRDNEVLRAKVDTMDLFAQVLRTKPDMLLYGASEDIVWRLQQEIELVEKQEAKNVQATV